MLEKTCSKCKRVLPADRFNKTNWLASGLRSDCKDCYSAFKNEWWANQPKGEQAVRQQANAALALIGKRRCRTCEKTWPLTDEHFSKGRGRWMVNCRECDRVRARKWANDNSERYKAIAVEGGARRRAAKQRRTIKLSPEHRRQMKEVYAECRRRNKDNPAAWHVDHIVPLMGKSVSGLHVPWNLQILPGTLNAQKSNKWVSEESCLLDVAIAA
jgi:hypothetical protein